MMDQEYIQICAKQDQITLWRMGAALHRKHGWGLEKITKKKGNKENKNVRDPGKCDVKQM